jgi:hypothetical protein
VCDVQPDVWQADYRLLDTALVPGGIVSTATSWTVDAGNPQVVACPVDPDPPPDPPPTTAPPPTAPPTSAGVQPASLEAEPAAAVRTSPRFTG